MKQEEALKILIGVANLAQASGLFKTFADAEQVHQAIKVFTTPPLKEENEK